MQSLATLLISGVLLATGAHAQTYYCADNGKKGTANIPTFEVGDDGKSFALVLDSTNNVGSGCRSNVDAFDASDCTDENPWSTSLSTGYDGTSGLPTVTTGTLSVESQCYFTRGECNQAMRAKITWNAVAAANGADCATDESDSSFTQVSLASGDTGTVTATTAMNDAISDAKTDCEGATTGGSACVRIAIGSNSDCGTGDPSSNFMVYDFKFEGICTEDSFSVSSDVTESTINLGALMKSQVVDNDSGDETTTFESQQSLSYAIQIGDFNVPTVEDDGTGLAVVGDLDAGSSYNLLLSTKAALTTTIRNKCSSLSANSRPSQWSDCTSDPVVTDCFQVVFADDSNSCDDDADAPDLSSYSTQGDVNHVGDTAGSSWRFPLTFDCTAGIQCCHHVGIKVEVTTDTICTNGRRRRLSGNSRHLQEEEDRGIFGMSYSMAVATSGADSSEFVGGADPSRVSDSGGSAGWLPAVAVGGLLLLGGAVVAVTRRPSLLRGAFHGPTKVLPNEDN
jgi:hypothetical protein